ncbi:hypothetical protein [Ralstonia solanacearum]|uniref:hypothetical protein n=1 Tax=Ralstonia solanacearum TaxID=305 RepID=UPI0011D1B048|nr:hypothetical protein [Ralstonia solanacearum]
MNHANGRSPPDVGHSDSADSGSAFSSFCSGGVLVLGLATWGLLATLASLGFAIVVGQAVDVFPDERVSFFLGGGIARVAMFTGGPGASPVDWGVGPRVGFAGGFSMVQWVGALCHRVWAFGLAALVG